MAPGIDEALVDRLYRQANAARWQVPLPRFGRALEASAAKAFGGRAASAADLERYLGSLRLEELALACACAEGNDAAWEHFVLEYRSVLYRAADAMDAGGGARELADSLYADLFGLQEREGERQSLFRYFHGRSTLATWLRAVLAQRLVDRARAERRQAPLPEVEPAAPEAPPPDPDRARYLDLIHAAFRDSVAVLEGRDRLRLRYYYVHQLTLAETGRLLGEHEASVSRHLAAARKAIRRDVERRLREASLDPAQIERCFECVIEEGGSLDLEGLLGSTGARKGARIVQRSEGGPVERGLLIGNTAAGARSGRLKNRPGEDGG
jgi:RNA polymerase sigma-70 factor (ECF subfamily)